MNSIKEYGEFDPSEDVGDSSKSKGKRGGRSCGRACTCGEMSSSDMMMTVAIDSNEKRKSVNLGGGVGGGGCCSPKNNRTGNDDESEIGAVVSGKKSTNPAWLESSFVHLVTPRSGIRTAKAYEDGLYHHQPSGASSSQSPYPQIHQGQHHSEHGFLERHRLMLQLLQAANADIDDSHDDDRKQTTGFLDGCCPDGEVELCFDCIERVASALDSETQRLYAEVDAYQEHAESSKREWKMLQRAANCVTSVGIGSNLSSRHSTPEAQANDGDDDDGDENFIENSTIEEAYREEIAALEREIEIRNDELLNYKRIHREQIQISDELRAFEEDLQRQDNSLELQSEAFDNRRQVLTKTLAEVQTEVDKLTCVSLLRMLFDLQVDQARGLHYPLINHLRLAFRPKGDVPAQEIQVAWSQATQLLLILGTLLEYPGKDWKLVPLSDCAKLIYRKEIFNLVPGDCRSLIAWNALLDQVVKHALSFAAGDDQKQSRAADGLPVANRAKFVPPPYPSSPTTIGTTELARLDPTDHVGWSQVIHRMASNLLWLSNRASSLAAIQVSILAHCVV